MNRKPSVFAVRALGVLAVIAMTLVPTMRSSDHNTARSLPQPSANGPASAPIILAQGRCYNGKCY